MLHFMATNNSRAVFDATAATYDRDRMKLIPGHEAFYAAALELIPTDAMHIVELGAGSGLVSSLSIHHLEDERKHALLRPIFTALRPGGLFINADHIAGPTPELEEIYQLRWLADVRTEGATEQQIADSLYRQQEDRRTPVSTQLAWLRDTGFTNVDCWYKHSSFAVMSGTRP